MEYAQFGHVRHCHVALLDKIVDRRDQIFWRAYNEGIGAFIGHGNDARCSRVRIACCAAAGVVASATKATGTTAAWTTWTTWTAEKPIEELIAAIVVILLGRLEQFFNSSGQLLGVRIFELINLNVGDARNRS